VTVVGQFVEPGVGHSASHGATDCGLPVVVRRSPDETELTIRKKLQHVASLSGYYLILLYDV
jgi:hypothetical protein